MKKLIATTLVFASMATAVTGCNSGNRSSKPVYGPGSTGNIGGGGSGGGGGVPGTPGQFTAGAALKLGGRMQHTATTLSDGRVLVVGGADAQGLVYTDSEVFDPLANAWTETSVLGGATGGKMINANAANFETARQLHTATLLPTQNKVLIVSGFGAERVDPQNPQQPLPEALTTCFLFDPVGAGGQGANTFTAANVIPSPRFWHNATVMADGKVLVAGGFDATGNSATSAAVYDPTTGNWTAVAVGSDHHAWGVMVTTPPGSLQAVTVLHAGAVVTPQGITGFPTARTQKFANGAFTAGPASVVGDVINQAGNAMSAGRALFAGGLVLQGQNLVATNLTEIFDHTGNGAFTAGPNLNTARHSALMAEIGTSSDQIIVGGLDAAGAPVTEAEIFGAFSNAMLGTVPMQDGRIDHAVVTLRSGQVMVIGGQDGQGTQQQPPTVYDSTEIYTR